MQSTWLSIRWNIVLAVVITYLVIAALFESWLYPLIIMLSVPLGAVGGFIGLWLLNIGLATFSPGTFQPLDMFTMVGFIMLVGTVVNNPILIVEQGYRFHRGDPMQKREPIAPAALAKFGAPLQLSPATPEHERRLALAKWIVDRRNPLTARVIVNRLWQRHFGRGLVDTPSDFGLNG